MPYVKKKPPILLNTSMLDQLASLHSAPLRYLVPLSQGVEYNETPMGISRLQVCLFASALRKAQSGTKC